MSRVSVGRIVALLLSSTLGCTGADGPTGPAGAGVTVTPEASGPNCALGGVAVSVDGGTPTYVCNGPGGASVDAAAEPPGSNCPDGGVAISSGEGAPVYVCAGADGVTPTVTGEPAGFNCTYGGLAVQVGTGPASYVCDGAPGTDGSDGLSAIVSDAGSSCPYGGIAVQVGTGGVPSYVCNGAPGADGSDGLSAIVTDAGTSCLYGGIAVQIGPAGAPAHVCNGAPGADGLSVVIGDAGSSCPSGGISVQVGPSGVASYVCNGATPTITAEPVGPNCAAGGVRIQLGDEPPLYVCNGTSVVLDPCVDALYGPIQDPWGATWDGSERGLASFSQAQAACEAIGGRLPIATELLRVSAVRAGGVGETYDTNYLWTLDPTSPSQQIVGRMSDGTFTSSDLVTARPYRCLCPRPHPASFGEDACFGSPGATCGHLSGTEGGRYNVDNADRAPLPKGAAIWECAFVRAHLADPMRLMEGIVGGLPNGSGAWLHTADDGRFNYDIVLKWTGTQPAWSPDATNVTVGALTDYRPFRCAGLDFAAEPFPATVVGEFVGPSSRYKSESADNAASGWAAAHGTCSSRGGHLARSTELGELIQEGLPGGSATWLWTSDQEGWNGVQFLAAAIVWSGVDTRFTYASPATNSWIYKTDAARPFRCIYYPLDPDYTGPATDQCNGGCVQLPVGSGPATMWFDAFDRVPASLNSASRDCLINGGRLASERDLTEAIRAGLPNGSATYIHTSDVEYGESGINVGIVRWTGTGSAAFADQYPTDSTWGALTDSRPYRCLWTNELR